MSRTLPRAACALLLLVGLRVWAGGTPLQLPPGESAEAWRTALDLAGFTLGPGRPGVEILVVGDRWVIIAWDAAGVARAAEVARPTTPRGREELVWLAASLARTGAAPPSRTPPALPPVPPPVPPPLPPSAPERPRPAPVAVVAPPEAVVPVAPPPPPDPPVDVPAPPSAAAPTPPAEPAPTRVQLPPPTVQGYAALSALAALRGGQAATGGVSFGGLARRGPLWWEARGLFLAGAGLVPLGADDQLSLWGASTSAGWVGRPGPATPRLGLGLTAQRVAFQEAGYEAQVAWNPAVHLDAGVDLALGPGVALTLGGRVGADLRQVVFETEGDPTASLSRVWLWPSLGLLITGE